MRKLQFLLIVLSVLLPSLSTAQTNLPQTATIGVDQIHAGQRGVAYTVFQGIQPEAMDVEVLGVLRNANGPKGDIILVRLHGTKVEYTGVVAGMSGSPVYIDGKLAGALAFRIGEFSKEPIAGVTPIRDMLEINALDHSPAEPVSTGTETQPKEASRTASPGEPAEVKGYANYLRPIETPLVFTGFSEDVVRRFASDFSAAGIVPVLGAGSVSGTKQPEPLVPGTAVSAVLVRGDMDIAATCTVTYADAEKLLACGHPLLQFGRVDFPMSKAEVLATLPSPANAFKIVNTTEPAGTFVQDRHTGILGLFNKEPKMVPVTLTIHGGTTNKQVHYEVLNNARITPVAMMVTVFNALHGLNEYGEETTYRLKGRIQVNGYPDVALKNLYSPNDFGQPAAIQLATSVGDHFGRVFDNAYNAADIRGVQLDLELIRERRGVVLESARTDLIEARPGDELIVETVLRPYRGERIVRRIPIRIPASVSKGNLRILVSDGDTLERLRRGPLAAGRKLDVASTIAMLNREHKSDRLYVSLLEADPEAVVGDKVMPNIPLSVMNVMDGLRNSQEMFVFGESAVNETSTELDYVVSGFQLLNLTIK
jgi:hypothetical protein